jgi:FkbM family methyltransferase
VYHRPVTARRIVQSAANRLGVEIRRFPKWDGRLRTVNLLAHHRIDTVLDVGANVGQYASGLRTFGYDADIVSFEPVTQAYDELRRATTPDDRWEARNLALGADERDVTINVAGNHAASSSVLSMLERHRSAAPEANFVGTESVRQSTVDRQVEALDGQRRVYLKIDTQGYERQVLEGATRSLSSGLVVGLQLELSFVPLYSEAPTWLSLVEYVDGLGMVPMWLEPGFTDPRNGQMLQADFVFFTSDAASDAATGPVVSRGR